MIELSRKSVRQMIEHAEQASPRESCGLLFQDMTVRPMKNVAPNDNEFWFDEQEQLMAFALLNIEEVLAVYHSHPLHVGAIPSQPDLSQHWPEEAYMIITCGTEIRAWLNGEEVGIHYVE